MKQVNRKKWRNEKFSPGDLVFVSLLEYKNPEQYFENVNSRCFHWWFDFEETESIKASTIVNGREALLRPHFYSEPLMFVRYRGIPLANVDEESVSLAEHRFVFLRYDRKVSIVFVIKEEIDPFVFFDKTTKKFR